MNYKKEAFKRILFGVPLGIAIGATITLIISVIMQGGAGGGYYSSMEYYVRGYFISAFIGAVFGGASVIWDIEKWSLLKQTITYFVITIITHLGSALAAKWIPFDIWAILMYVGIYIVLFAIIFVIVYSVQKRRVEEVNKALSE